ncbi:hypothetical protein KCU83_g4905, partial [Aureobasidium melanogenum]
MASTPTQTNSHGKLQALDVDTHTTLASLTITDFQRRVYKHLLSIPAGTVTSYATLARQLSTSPRAIGGALRKNPLAPQIPCHRVIAANGFVGGFMGDWQSAPSGVNQVRKLELLQEEGVEFTTQGYLVVKKGIWFKGPWDV